MRRRALRRGLVGDVDLHAQRAPGVRVTHPPQANAVFAYLPQRAITALHADGWRFYDFIAGGGCPLMCARDTTEEAVDADDADVGVVADARAELDWLRARRDLDASRIVVLGQSLGGATALRLAAGDDGTPTLRGLILDAPFASYRGIARDAAGPGALTAPASAPS